MHRFCLAVLTLTLLIIPLRSQDAVTEKTDRILKLFHDEFIAITPGQGKYPKSFTMGSPGSSVAAESPAHTVTFGYPFSMARYEVTQELWQTVMALNASKWKGPRNSAEMMTWQDANQFCAKVTGLLQKRKLLGAEEEIRLPSEAEWEYICRAGTTTAYSFGDKVDDLTHYAWFRGNSRGHDPPVGVKKANAWGFYDVHGYLWEFCSDTWHANYEGAPTDGSAWTDGKTKDYVIRGGSWTDPADTARSAYRKGVSAETKNDAIGFRCVRAKRKGS